MTLLSFSWIASFPLFLLSYLIDGSSSLVGDTKEGISFSGFAIMGHFNHPPNQANWCSYSERTIENERNIFTAHFGETPIQHSPEWKSYFGCRWVATMWRARRLSSSAIRSYRHSEGH